jgi:hypothetical protein
MGFMSDGTIAFLFPGAPTPFTVGHYLGIPGALTVYSWSTPPGFMGPFQSASSFGLSIGPFSAELASVVTSTGTSLPLLVFSHQYANGCPGAP